MSVNEATARENSALAEGQILYQRYGTDMDKTKEQFLKTEFADLWDSYVSIRLNPIRQSDDRFMDRQKATPWYQLDKTDEYWPAYEQVISKKWGQGPTTSISQATAALMDRLPNPQSSNDMGNRYGMVVGRVQSGKTGHFTGLMARAADKGYNLFIVLSGMYNNLRSQTQKRLDQELTGTDVDTSQPFVSEPKQKWNRLTNQGVKDFDGDQPISFLRTPSGPMLAVIKKEKTALFKLRKWLKRADEAERKKIHLMLIDDEADYASVNTSNRGFEEEIPVDFDEGEMTTDEKAKMDAEDEKNSIINSYVRSILGLFENRAYVGYTATPYANVFIDPEDHEEVFEFDEGEETLGMTLYPRDFITKLDKPTGYIGLEDLFPIDPKKTAISRICITNPDEPDDHEGEFPLEPDGKSVKALSEKPGIDELPQSLQHALYDYCLAGAARVQSGDKDGHCSMMIHTAVETDEMFPVALLVRSVIRHWIAIIQDELDDDGDLLREGLQERWEAEFAKKGSKIKYSDLYDDIVNFLKSIQFRILNDKKKEARALGFTTTLDYDSEEKMNVIVIGGILLSRGLTIEGLTTSYFLREARNYDTLIQMGRWFGIRIKYGNLVRIHLNKRLLEWFHWLTRVEKDLREEIDHYSKRNMSPLDFAVRVLRYDAEGPKMRPCDRSKMRSVKVVGRGLQRTEKSAKSFPIDDVDALVANLDAVENLLHGKTIPCDKAKNGHLVWNNVDSKEIIKYLDSIQYHHRSLDKEGIRAYINHMNKTYSQELGKWSVVLVHNSNGNVHAPFTKIPQIKFGLPTRSRDSRLGIPGLTTDKHWSIDLPGWPAAFQNLEGTFERALMWDKRGKKQPLLLLYIIDKDPKRRSKQGHLFPMFDDPTGNPHVAAPAFFFPERTLTKQDKEKLRTYYRLAKLGGSGK